MKFVLAYTICSAITGLCNVTSYSPVEFNKWTDCTIAGSTATIEVTKFNLQKFNEDKLYVTYSCTEIGKENA